MLEKRRGKRMGINVKIKLNHIKNYKDVSNLKSDEFEVKLINVSETGIAFKSKEELKLNTFYDTKMVLWDKQEFDTVIEVVRMENTGEDETVYGCRFVGIMPNNSLDIKIHELLSENN